MAGMQANDPTARDITERIRMNPAYQDWVQRNGLNSRTTPTGFTATSSMNSPLRDLNDQQRQDLDRTLRAAGINIPDGYEVDTSGGVSKKTHNLRNFGLSAAAIVGGPMAASYLAGAPAAAEGASVVGNPAFATPLEAFPAAEGAAGALPATSTAFTGGLSSTVPSVPAGAGGGGFVSSPGMLTRLKTGLPSILGDAAKARSNSRQVRDSQNLSRDRINLDRYELGLKAPGARLRQSNAASLVANRKPVKANFTPGSGKVSFEGGFNNPDLYSPEYKAMADDIMHQNLVNQLKHGDDIPRTSDPEKEGWGDKLLGGAAFGSSILGLF